MKTQIFKKTLIAFLAMLFLAAATMALVFVNLPAQAEDSVTVTIHADAYGTVEYVVDGNAEEPETYGNTVDVGNQSEPISISTDQYLHLKATISEEAAVDHLFQYWTTEVTDHDVVKAVSSAVSLKSEDTFGFQELQTLATNDLYANFVAKITNTKVPEMVDKAKLQFDYNADLGDVYFFMGNPDVEEHFIIAHGIKLDPKQPYSLPLDNKPNPIAGAAVRAYYPNFLAVPKTDIQSSMDSRQHTTAKFGGWTAAYYNYDNNSGTILAQSTGVIPGYKNGTTVEEFWKAWQAGGTEYAQVTHMKNANPANLVIYPSRNTEWDYNDTDKPLYFDPMSMGVIFQEVPLIPNISADKQEGDKPVENIEKIENGQQITFDFGNKNTLTLHIGKIGSLTKEDLSIMIDGVEYNNQIEDIGGPDFIFPYQLHGRATVTISYANKEDEKIAYSDFGVTFYLEETSEGTIADIIKTPVGTNGTLTITNDNDNKWIFDPVLSEVDNYAYGLKVETEWRNGNYWGVKTLSNLTFALSGAETGSVSFEFQLKGYYQEASLLTKNLKVGQLWYGDQLFTNSDNLKVGVEKKQTNSDEHYWDEEIDGATWLGRPKVDSNTEYNQNAVVYARDGWYRASIPIKQGSPVYLGFLVCGWDDYTNMGTPYYKAATVSIRNVQLATGNKDVTLKLGADAGNSTATATIGDNDVHNASTDGDRFTVSAGATVKLAANLQGDDMFFYGWSVGGQLVSTETNATVFINDTSDIIAWIAPNGTYAARIGGMFYKTVKEAVENATDGQTIIVIKDTTIDQSLTINEGVTLLLPYSSENKLTATGNQNKISWIADSKANSYLTVTVTGNATITVEGELAVGGVVNCAGQGYQGHTSGAYSELILEKGSKIQVASGGVMDVYGRVWGGDGKTGAEMGTVEVLDGGKVYEPFLILDFSGGTNAANAFLSDNPTTPFKRYAMINIECPITVNYGGELLGHASLYALSQFFSLDQPFISKKTDGGDDTFVMLSEGSKVTITYDPSQTLKEGATTANCTEGIGKIKMVFKGGATFSYMKFSAMGITVPTNSVYFSIPYNFEVELNDFASPPADNHAQYETKTDFMIMPGAKVTVGAGAMLTLNANAWVFDGFEQKAVAGKSYPTATQLQAAGYSISGHLIVNGTLKIGKKTTVQKFEIFGSGQFTPQIIGATFLGIVQTNGNGRIEIPHNDTILSGKIQDGINGTNYFAYTTKARVWDAAHNCFGNLEAGHTYTATSGDTFTLSELKYSNTKDSKEDNLTLTLKQTMRGSWKVEHDGHTYNWNPKDGENDELSAENPIIKLTRQCTEIGCTEEEHKNLLYLPESLGDLIYKGAAYTLEEIKSQLFENYFTGDKASGFAVNLSELSGSALTQGDYTVKAALTSGYFLQGEQYVTEATLKFKIIPFTITNDNVKITQSKMQYTGEDITPTYSVTWNGEGAVTYEASWQDNKNAGENAKLIITANGQFTGKVTVKFTIAPKPITVTVKDKETVYTGEAQTYSGGVNVTDYTVGEGLYPSDDLQITLSATGTEAGDYNISGESANTNYTVTFKGENGEHGIYKINPAPVTFTLEKQEYEYTGEKIQPNVNAVWGGSKTLDAGKYSITYGDNTNVADTNNVTVKITDDNFIVMGEEKTKTLEFTITPKNITGAQVKVTKEYTYTGSEIQPQKGDVTVSILEWNKDIDFTVTSYDNNTNAGAAAKVTVTGNGNYTGTATGTFEIKAKSIEGATVTVNKEYTYTGSAIQPELGDITVTLTEWDKEIEFAISACSENTDAGKAAQVTVKGTGNYTGTATGNFEIKPAEVTFSLEKQEYEYTGSQIQPGVNVTWNDGTALDKGRYGLTYGANTNVSDEDISVSIELNDTNFTIAEESKKLTFKITPKDIKDAQVTVNGEYTYTGSAIHPSKDKITATVSGLQVTFAEEIEYGKNADVSGGGTVTITGTNNFQGTATGKFEIKAKDLQGATVTITTPPETIIYKNAQWQPAFTVQVDGISGTLSADSDYDVEYGDNITVADGGKITVKGKGNFTGEVAQTFIIKAKDVTIKVNGGNIEFGKAPEEPYELTITGLLSDVSEEMLKGKLKYSVQSPDSLEAGNKYTVTPSFKNNESLANYSVTFEAGEYTIIVAELSGVKFNGETTVVYNGESHKLEVTGLPAEANGVKVKYNGGESEPIDEGTYTVTAEITFNNGATHTLSGGTLTITAKTVQITVKVHSVIYNGAEQTLNEVYSWQDEDDGILARDRDKVTITLTAKGTEAKSYSITANESGDNAHNYKIEYTGLTNGYVISPKSIEGATVTVSGEYTYTGDEIKPQKSNITVTLAGWNHDITISDTIQYSKNTDASATAQVTVEGNGNYTGNATGTFEIKAKSIEGATVTVNKEYTYTGSAIQPELGDITVTLKDWSHDITISSEVQYSNNTDAGKAAQVTVEGIGNYTGTATGNFEIKPAEVTFSLEKQEYEYTGEKIQPKVNAVWGGSKTLDSDKYSITYGENTNVADTNNVTVEITDKNFTVSGDIKTKTLAFKIIAKDISKADVKVTGDYTYTGNEIKPQKSNITVTLKDWNLDITISDTVQYSQNTNASQEAKVTVTGSGNYTGEATGTFEIKAKSIEGATVTITTPAEQIVYKNAQWQPNFTVQVDGIASALTNKDYDVTYGENKSVGEGQITINGKGNFIGEAEKTFTIKQKDVSITLESQEAEYNGAEQTVSSASDYWHADGLIEGDDLQVKLTGSKKEVGSVQISVESINKNYNLTNEPTAVFTVTAKKIDVTIKDQTCEYSNSAPEVKQGKGVAWESDGVCGDDELGITIEKSAGVTVKEYDLTAKAQNPNYSVTFRNEKGEEKPATFEITKKKVTVTVAPKGSVYGDDLAELSYTYDGVIEGDGFDIKNYIEISTDATQYSKVLGSYTISVKLKGEEAQNYAIDCTSTAAYTLTARPVKYTIDNQSSVYNGKVPQVAQKYTLKEGTVVNNDTLGIKITATELKKDAGKYALTGDWTNKNYAVTFEDGEYEITKLDISENITISVNEENNTDECGNIIAQYSGEPLEVLGMAYSEIEGDEELEIKVTTDVATIEKMGNYTVKATIDDKNYTGEKSFTVIVSDENGYTENIYKVLEELEERTKGINPDDLKEDDFEVLKEARKLIDSLTNDEQEAASEELAEYEQLIAAWNNATTVDEDVIKTAKNIADAPMSALIVIASVSAIAALAYVIGKGGKII